jgi:hypothetical protein
VQESAFGGAKLGHGLTDLLRGTRLRAQGARVHLGAVHAEFEHAQELEALALDLGVGGLDAEAQDQEGVVAKAKAGVHGGL